MSTFFFTPANNSEDNQENLPSVARIEMSLKSAAFYAFLGTSLISGTSSMIYHSASEPDEPRLQYVALDGWNTNVGSATDLNLMLIINLDKIQKMALLSEDWNGTGGQKFSKEAIRLFMEVVESLKIQPQIAPTGRNSMLLQYDLNDKSILAFELTERNASKVYVPQGDFNAAQTEVFTDSIAQQINNSVEQAYGYKYN